MRNNTSKMMGQALAATTTEIALADIVRIYYGRDR
ncbi:MAG: hypothetical protein ACI9OW_001229 [Marinobacter psychrophilus]|jgi:hypothetical protein